MITLTVIKWLLTVASILGATLNAARLPRAGHGVWIGANAGWCAVWLVQGERQAAVLFFVYLLITVYGFRRWQ